jgi:hypothetical protein
LIESLLNKQDEIAEALRATGVNAQTSFKELDRNKVGFLRFEKYNTSLISSFDDLSREVNSYMPPEEIVAIFRLADIDRDRRLTFSEFVLLFDGSSKEFLYTNQNGVLGSIQETSKKVDQSSKVPLATLVKPSYQQFE